jgi:hypothetical protein
VIWSLVVDEESQALDLAQLLFVAGLGLLSYGAWLVYEPAGYIVPGVIVVWWTLPARGPFVRKGKPS